MFRLHFLVFFGAPRMAESVKSQIHEAGSTVTTPLIVLAVLSAIAGFAGLPQVYGDWLEIANSNSLANFQAPALATAHVHEIGAVPELRLALAAVVVALLGACTAWMLYLRRPGLPERIAAAFAGLYRTLVNKYWVDELYDRAIVRPLVVFSERVLFRGIDAGLIDGVAVMGTARGVQRLAANGLKYAQSGLTQSYLVLMLVGVTAAVSYLLG
jgi:NADH-quinone oxidoreductase subunit L